MEGKNQKAIRKKNRNSFFLILAFSFNIFSLNSSFAQSNIPVGSWRIHTSYLGEGVLSGSENSVFSLGSHSLFYLNINTNKVNTLTVLDGLYDQNFSAGAFDPISKKFIIAFPDGTIQLVGEREIQTVNSLRENPQVTQKSINRVRIKGGFVLLAGDFGVLRINPVETSISASFTNLGRDGGLLAINDIAEDDKFLYLASKAGLLLGDKNSNLNDFRNWRRIGESIGEFINIALVAGKIIAIHRNGNLYFLENDKNQPEQIIGIQEAKNLHFYGERLFFQMGNGIYAIDENASWNLEFDTEIQSFSDFFINTSGIYYQVQGKGIVSQNGDIFAPPGPRSQVRQLLPTSEGLLGIPFSKNILGETTVSSTQESSRLFEGRWEALESPDEIVSVAQMGNDLFLGTFSNGLWKKNSSGLQQIQIGSSGHEVSISAIHTDAFGHLWVGIADDKPRLLKINSTGNINSVAVEGLSFPYKIISDRTGNLWILNAPLNGNSFIQVFHEQSNLNRILGSASNNGSLPPGNVMDIAIDANQQLWISTGNGVLYVPNASDISDNNNLNALTPIFQGRPLFSGVNVRQILVAPDQSKWFGTVRDGIWRFSEFGNELLEHFNQANSPLISNNISNLNLDPVSGELLIVQEHAAFSYRGSSIKSAPGLESLKIFPNPVRPDFNGVLSIEGLIDFAKIKITSSAGRVVFSSQVQGGKVIWNLRELQGGRVKPGVYLVFVTDKEGIERVSGKFVVL
ncbi:Immunoreactive 84kD antigen PG93 [Indibacter alkaliphilus LW1]|uniref:Immunoreactive 84kD antigen PG93 n=1 Tax=Indibacter alkaliphilus (strain CCUG 57479 / KCTC 22604 / LW1) TaxID=1189612 RepID=S2DJF9_INDAL|nr:T9SS type A sorting domain-containing protein [Indibacter alkaliphilus]EOZ92096.1 Immunoreactive 84kD antigen PG93 [Indibacter alkaliphilus LW1]